MKYLLYELDSMIKYLDRFYLESIFGLEVKELRYVYFVFFCPLSFKFLIDNASFKYLFIYFFRGNL